MKKVIINADDFGYSEENNKAILSGIKSNIINSVSLMVNMNGYSDAVAILPQVQDVSIGLHFNISEGRCLSKSKLLANSVGEFDKDFFYYFMNQNNKKILNEIEAELKLQLESALKCHTISHLDSHRHIHSIPNIFEIFVRVAKEYGVKYIRTQREIPYIVKEKVFDKRFLVNYIKNVLLNYLTSINRKKLNGLNSNDYILGVLYTGYMDELAIYNGIKSIKDDEGTIEVIFHPYFPTDINQSGKMDNYREFLITKTPEFNSEIEKLGCQFELL